ncbi:MAG: histidine kinase [Thermoleophilia bacterium]
MNIADGKVSLRSLVEATKETERIVAWLRLLVVALLVAGQSIDYPHPHRAAFGLSIIFFLAWSLAVIGYVYARPVTFYVALVITVGDVVAITALALLSGGAFSQAWFAYLLIPIAVAFRFRPAFTAVASGITTVAYLLQALSHPTSKSFQADRVIAVHAGYLLWVGLASVLLSSVLGRRTRFVAQLAAAREQLLADAMSAEDRQRQLLAESLHDEAIQNLLSARHDLQEVSEEIEHPSLIRAEQALAETVRCLRETIMDLHPTVLEHGGLEVALPAVGRRAAQQGGFAVRFDLRYRGRHPQERVLLQAARELLANAVRHSAASEVVVGLRELNGDLVLTVADNGVGFSLDSLTDKAARGHVGLVSQRIRIEGIGGRLEIRSSPGSGTLAEVRIPLTT